MRRLAIGFVVMGWLVACSSDAANDTTSTGSDAGTGNTGTDAGGSTDQSDGAAATHCASPPCADGDLCATGTDCKSGICTSNKCIPIGCTDGIKDDDETDVDCGGSCINGCGPTKGCEVATDCLDGVCGTSKTCTPPTSGDHLKNGNESDVDCGSSTTGRFDTHAARCDAGKVCAADADCKSGGCNLDTKTCAFARSCATTNGGTTCGAGDVTSASKDHEDCCTSAEVPVYNQEGYSNGTKFRLDKYTITAGRMRKFLNAVNGNVQGWVQANRSKILAPAQLPDTLDPYLPTGWTQADSNDQCKSDSSGNTFPCNYGALAQVSGYRYNNEPGGDNGYGCNMGEGAYGARTFYLSDAELAQLGDGEGQHKVPTGRLGQKALNCTNYYMLAAFCAWDGGRLETLAEYNAAYGGDGSSGRTYPWGSDATTRAIGFYDALNSNLFPIYNFNPATWPGADSQCTGTECTTAVGGVVPIAVGSTRYSVYNPNLSQADASAILLRLRRANAFYNYANYITSAQGNDADGFFQQLGATEKSYVKVEDVDQSNDQSVAVAPPGRYPTGRGRYGHSDLLGNLIEITATPVTTVGPGNLQYWARNGSYEVAHFNQQTMTGGTYQKSMLTKYARAGGRCARPVDIYPSTPLP